MNLRTSATAILLTSLGSACSFFTGVPQKSSPNKYFQIPQIIRLLKTKQCPGCDLDGANLTGANLQAADLRKANLSNYIT